MKLDERIAALVALGEYLQAGDEALQTAIRQAYHHNRWFTEASSQSALQSIATHYLDANKLVNWVAEYDMQEPASPKAVGLIMAGNIPLVGFHDLLSVFASGHHALVKLSSKDTILTRFLIEQLYTLHPDTKTYISIVDTLKGFDAVIATGSDNSARYFDQYFGKYPHIIRKNRNSVAVLRGDESETEIQTLGHDIFDYFGLGCRNVSKLLVPREYDFVHFLDSLEPYNVVMDNDKYKNNYDYNRTILLLNQTPHLASDYLVLQEDSSLHSKIATLHYEYYDELESVKTQLSQQAEQIQCVVSPVEELEALPYGKAQHPGLMDYADKVDTMAFLLNLE